MQEYKDGELQKTVAGTLKELSALEMASDATHRVIGKLPVVGSVVQVNGLEFVVVSLSAKKGRVTLEIRKP
jgi:hypothetical protein